MRFFTKDFPARQFTLYPLGDWHLGSRACDIKFIQQVIDEIRGNPEARWVGMGDFIENAIIGSKSDVYLQTIPPEEQVEAVCDLLDPIAKKGLFLITGNHEQRNMRVVGQAPETVIGYRLRIPFMKYSCMAVFDLTRAKTPRTFSAYFHHNYGGGWSPGGKVNRAAALADICPTVDAIFSGHSHITARVSRTWFEPGYKQVTRKVGYDYIIGAALRWNESYAEERGKRAATVEHIKVTFKGNTNGRANNRAQIYEVITPKEET